MLKVVWTAVEAWAAREMSSCSSHVHLCVLVGRRASRMITIDQSLVVDVAERWTRVVSSTGQEPPDPTHRKA